MWYLRAEDLQPDEPLLGSSTRARATKFFRSDIFHSGSRPRREGCRTGIWSLLHGFLGKFCRGFSFLFFCCGCLGSLAQLTAPWLLGAADAAIHLVVYFAFVPGNFVLHLIFSTGYRFSFRSSLEDVLLVALGRAAAVCLAACLGRDRFRRPYLVCSALCAAAGVAFIAVKAALFRYHGAWWLSTVMLSASLGFSLCHLLCSMRVVELARRRHSQGLVGFNVRAWEEGEEAWMNANMWGRPSPLADCEWSSQCAWRGDVPPEALADADSRFIKIDGVSVHFKVEEPPGGSADPSSGIVLVHGFGAGVFAWRHIMAPLAQATGCRVVAFDRPAFGLTSRPARVSKDWNPYSVKFQADMALQLCAALGIRRLVVAGHADGALVALLMAAASQPIAGDGDNAAGPSTSEDGSEARSGPCSPLLGNLSRSPPRLHSSVTPGKGREDPDATAVVVDLGCSHGVEALALALLHPSLEGEIRPQFMRLLGNSRLGRRIMRPLLRTEIGEVANRRAWFSAEKITPEVLDVYKRPLCVLGWDTALMKVSKLRQDAAPDELACMLERVGHAPALVLGGAHDRVVPARRLGALHQRLPRSSLCLLPNCGHMSHEEEPGDLLLPLEALVRSALAGAARPGSTPAGH